MSSTTYFVSHCPLNGTCRWRSDPQTSEAHATEALRAHVNDHSHADLVGFVTVHHTVTISRYIEQAS